MSEKPSPSTLRLLVGILIGLALASFALAGWMLFRHQTTPLLLLVTGAICAALAGVIAAQGKKTP
ncbi:hypothetical protein BH09PSE2_BH09PSE2_22170 [soil metagenome]